MGWVSAEGVPSASAWVNPQRTPEKAQRRMNGQRNPDPHSGRRIGGGCTCDLASPDEKEGASLELKRTFSRRSHSGL